jgi:hypothetical protein
MLIKVVGVNVGYFDDVSEVQATSVLRAKLCWAIEFL